MLPFLISIEINRLTSKLLSGLAWLGLESSFRRGVYLNHNHRRRRRRRHWERSLILATGLLTCCQRVGSHSHLNALCNHYKILLN